jgi:enoyl-CoA hydratase/carnithine racemase
VPADDGGGPVTMERDGNLLRIVLDRPEVRNAFGASMRDGLVEALAVAGADPAVRVVLEGRGPSFCSGGDLREFGTSADPASAHLVRLRRSAGRAIAEVADRVTAVVHGSCVGAGVELPAFAGRVVAAPDSRFWLPEVAMGLVPGAGGTVSIPRRIGRQRTALLALTGDTIDATTALQWGLVDELAAG